MSLSWKLKMKTIRFSVALDMERHRRLKCYLAAQGESGKKFLEKIIDRLPKK